MYYVYVLLSKKDKKYYIGHTKDLRNRLKEHNRGRVESTCSRRPFRVIYYEASEYLKDTFKREKYLKSTYGHRYLRNRLRNSLEDT